jgi:hypothetical protein
VYCWGSNLFGQVGPEPGDAGVAGDAGDAGSTLFVNAPSAVPGLSGKVLQVVAGGDPGTGPGTPGFSCALLFGGAVECWGFNGDGELALGADAGTDTSPHPTPTPVVFP